MRSPRTELRLHLWLHAQDLPLDQKLMLLGLQFPDLAPADVRAALDGEGGSLEAATVLLEFYEQEVRCNRTRSQGFSGTRCYLHVYKCAIVSILRERVSPVRRSDSQWFCKQNLASQWHCFTNCFAAAVLQITSASAISGTLIGPLDQPDPALLLWLQKCACAFFSDPVCSLMQEDVLFCSLFRICWP